MEARRSRAAGVRAGAEAVYIPLPEAEALVKGALISAIASGVLAMLADLAQYALADRGTERGFLTDGEANAYDLLSIVALVQLIVFFVAAVFFVRWFRRAYRNLPALGAEDLRYRAWWTIGGWIIPILNLFRPKQIANDIWRASAPDALGAHGTSWRGGPVPAAFGWWWAAYLASGVLSSAAERASGGWTGGGDLSQLKTGGLLFTAADAVSILAGLLALTVVDRITRRQEALAVRLGFIAPAPPPEPAPVGRRARLALGGSGVAALTGAGAAIVLLVGTSAAPRVAKGVSPLSPTSSGILLADDFSDPASGWPVGDDGSLRTAYSGGGYQILVKSSQDEWYVYAPLGQRFEQLAVEAEAAPREGSNGDYYGVGCWRAQKAGYQFVVFPDGYYAILRVEGADESIVLTEGWAPAPKAWAADRQRIEGRCSGGAGPARLVLSVDGREIAKASDEDGVDSYDQIRLFAYSEDGGSDVRFDNLVVRRS